MKHTPIEYKKIKVGDKLKLETSTTLFICVGFSTRNTPIIENLVSGAIIPFNPNYVKSIFKVEEPFSTVEWRILQTDAKTGKQRLRCESFPHKSDALYAIKRVEQSYGFNITFEAIKVTCTEVAES